MLSGDRWLVSQRVCRGLSKHHQLLSQVKGPFLSHFTLTAIILHSSCLYLALLCFEVTLYRKIAFWIRTRTEVYGWLLKSTWTFGLPRLIIMIGHVDIDSGIRQTESLGAFSLLIPSLVVVSMQVCHARDLGSSPDRVKHKSYTDCLVWTEAKILYLDICIDSYRANLKLHQFWMSSTQLISTQHWTEFYLY